ncbi:MAG: hypothetical protein AAF184_11925 [Pseudomonadota bacterium]
MSVEHHFPQATSGRPVPAGAFVDIAGDRFYAITDVDHMAPFFVSVISSADHWLFVSSTGGLTAGRVSPDTSLFPYVTVDRIHESLPHTGPKTIVRVHRTGQASQRWEPFNREHDGRYSTSRQLAKSLVGHKLRFEEVNHDLQLAFRYTWETSAQFGLVRRCELLNLGDGPVDLEFLDGLANLLPAGTPRFTQTNSSNLVDAYKWTELDPSSGLALFTLYSGITDRAAPCESLKANVAYCLGLDAPTRLISSKQLEAFRHGEALREEERERGIRGAYFVHQRLSLEPGAGKSWCLVTDLERSQGDVVNLRNALRDPAGLAEAIDADVAAGGDALARIIASCDGYQGTAEENVAAHHYANVMWNVLRGGYFPSQYQVPAGDFAATVRSFNRPVYERHEAMLGALPRDLTVWELRERIGATGDRQLERLAQEYLPIAFGRRHGDPSRPWNQFSIRTHDGEGQPVYWYEGNWRDVFQNWEALAFSIPEYVEHMVAKFVNASTMDGYNPYRITKEGIDWEVEEPDDPWSYIGYWGDHQIIYLQKLLELSRQFHPERLQALLHAPLFAYANVPYRIRPFHALLEDPKTTVDYADDAAHAIEARLEQIGGDAKLILTRDGEVHQVTLLEKLLVPLLAKLGNLVVDGGIWMNTQRPEWNDANNALVGQGLSMVTLYYLRRYVHFLHGLLSREDAAATLSAPLAQWLRDTATALHAFRGRLDAGTVPNDHDRYALLVQLGEAASTYRTTVYAEGAGDGAVQALPMGEITSLLDDTRAVVDQSIQSNRREDGLYHAYNLLGVSEERLELGHLYPMLEGQVAALSAGTLAPQEAVAVLDGLFDSPIYRVDQHSFMLYPDRKLASFLDKNRLAQAQVEANPLLTRLLADGNEDVLYRDAEGTYRFNADFTNADDLQSALDALPESFQGLVADGRDSVLALFEQVFDHQAFTGRSGTMFGFEGLGCIYWHMVSKLLLAVQETFFAALEAGTDELTCHRLGEHYYQVRAGIGFNKSPAEFGAFPMDAYSHTPGHAGARQPGMTGQVKEEVLTRFGELGVRVRDGRVSFRPQLLRGQEFLSAPAPLRYVGLDDEWHELALSPHSLAFTWCQVPVRYALVEVEDAAGITVHYADGTSQSQAELTLSSADSESLFRREGRVREVVVRLGTTLLFKH